MATLTNVLCKIINEPSLQFTNRCEVYKSIKKFKNALKYNQNPVTSLTELYVKIVQLTPNKSELYSLFYILIMIPFRLFLKNEGIENVYVAEVNKYRNMRGDLTNYIKTSLEQLKARHAMNIADPIMCGLCWRKTLDGTLYWSRIYDKWIIFLKNEFSKN